MALQSPFFNKSREVVEPPANRYGPGSTTPHTLPNSPSAPSHSNGTASTSATTTPTTAADSSVSPKGVESKLTVGPNIKLKGVEITDCDTLVVEGTVEATMDSRVIQISERGSFTGSAEIDIAEIRGEFNGTLTVRQKLTIHTTGRVKGKIRYGKLIIEEGGQLSGEIEYGAAVNQGHGRPVAAGSPSNVMGLKAA